VSSAEPGILRVARGRKFVYRLPNGAIVRDARQLERIRKLAIPPAWRDVWICLDAHGHLQATGIDARGRKQYRYHVRWRSVRDQQKYHELLAFAEQLPRLRRRLQRDLTQTKLDKNKVLATVVSVMARTGIRVGNDRYVEANDSYGITTLLDRHARIERGTIQFSFRGKGGKPYRAAIRDRKLAAIVKRCRDIPGQRLFQYLDGRGRYQPITSSDVNEYLKRVTATEVTAKTFRTWAATLIAASELRAEPIAKSPTAIKRQINRVLCTVADALGNTPAICRKSYVDPRVVSAFELGVLHADMEACERRTGLTSTECALVALLRAASSRTARHLPRNGAECRPAA
jgi:DNA topoisomerase-1